MGFLWSHAMTTKLEREPIVPTSCYHPVRLWTTEEGAFYHQFETNYFNTAIFRAMNQLLTIGCSKHRNFITGSQAAWFLWMLTFQCLLWPSWQLLPPLLSPLSDDVVPVIKIMPGCQAASGYLDPCWYVSHGAIGSWEIFTFWHDQNPPIF